LLVGSSVMAATTMSLRFVLAPRCGARAARLQALRLSYMRPRVPSIGSRMHLKSVCATGVPRGKVTASPSSPSITSSTGQRFGQFCANHASTACSLTLSMP
jgi:hypothetical protein